MLRVNLFFSLIACLLLSSFHVEGSVASRLLVFAPMLIERFSIECRKTETK